MYISLIDIALKFGVGVFKNSKGMPINTNIVWFYDIGTIPTIQILLTNVTVNL